MDTDLRDTGQPGTDCPGILPEDTSQPGTGRDSPVPADRAFANSGHRDTVRQNTAQLDTADRQDTQRSNTERADGVLTDTPPGIDRRSEGARNIRHRPPARLCPGRSCPDQSDTRRKGTGQGGTDPSDTDSGLLCQNHGQPDSLGPVAARQLRPARTGTARMLPQQHSLCQVPDALSAPVGMGVCRSQDFLSAYRLTAGRPVGGHHP